MRTDMTSAQTVHKLLPLGFSDRVHKSVIMEKSKLDEVELRCACSILIQKGLALIFHDDQGRYYIPKDAEEIREFGTRHPNELRSQIAFFNRAKYGFHQGEQHYEPNR